MLNMNILIKTTLTRESRAAARKPRDAAAIPVGFHCHVVAFPFQVPIWVPCRLFDLPHRCVVFLVT